ncbi:hypothetical protein [Nocardia gipuzkoensis]
MTASEPALFLDPNIVGTSQQILVALETPYGTLLTPFEISV